MANQKVDKEDFLLLVKQLENLKKEISELKELKTQSEIQLQVNDYVFDCVVSTSQKDLMENDKVKEFNKEMEDLMKKYKVMRVIATFLKMM